MKHSHLPAEPWIVTLSIRLYSWLLHLGPKQFCRTYSRQMIQCFRQCCRDAYRQRSTAGVLCLWFPLFSEAVIGLLIERISSWERSNELAMHERMLSMQRTLRHSMIAVMYVSSLELALIAAIVLSLGLWTSGHPGNPFTGGGSTLMLIGVILAVLAFIPGTIAWIGALVKTAQQRRWGWFVALVLLLDLPMIAYLFAGPEMEV